MLEKSNERRDMRKVEKRRREMHVFFFVRGRSLARAIKRLGCIGGTRKMNEVCWVNVRGREA